MPASHSSQGSPLAAVERHCSDPSPQQQEGTARVQARAGVPGAPSHLHAPPRLVAAHELHACLLDARDEVRVHLIPVPVPLIDLRRTLVPAPLTPQDRNPTQPASYQYLHHLQGTPHQERDSAYSTHKVGLEGEVAGGWGGGDVQASGPAVGCLEQRLARSQAHGPPIWALDTSGMDTMQGSLVAALNSVLSALSLPITCSGNRKRKYH